MGTSMPRSASTSAIRTIRSRRYRSSAEGLSSRSVPQRSIVTALMGEFRIFRAPWPEGCTSCATGDGGFGQAHDFCGLLGVVEPVCEAAFETHESAGARGVYRA